MIHTAAKIAYRGESARLKNLGEFVARWTAVADEHVIVRGVQFSRRAGLRARPGHIDRPRNAGRREEIRLADIANHLWPGALRTRRREFGGEARTVDARPLALGAR